MQPIPLGAHKNIRNLQSFLQHGSGRPVLFKQCYNNSGPKTTVRMINFSGFFTLARKLRGLRATLRLSALHTEPTCLLHLAMKVEG